MNELQTIRENIIKVEQSDYYNANQKELAYLNSVDVLAILHETGVLIDKIFEEKLKKTLLNEWRRHNDL